MLTIFLADPSGPIRDRVRTMLSAADMQVVGEGTKPTECIDRILAAHPDVVVLEVQLEGGTGIQVLRGVRPRDPAISFVVCSNKAASAYRRRYLHEGAARFLDKSTDFERLAQAVASAGGRALALTPPPAP